MLKIIILFTRLSSLIVSLLSMTHFLLDTERESSQKYSGYVHCTESGSKLWAGYSKRHCPEPGSEKQDKCGLFWGGQTFDVEERTSPCPGLRRKQMLLWWLEWLLPSPSLQPHWLVEQVCHEIPIGSEALTPLHGSVFNGSNQHMAEHWEPFCHWKKLKE